jgi:hypothetical protein
MSALHASVLNTFKNQNWAYRKVPNMDVVEADFEAHHGKVHLHLQSFSEAHILSVVATASIPVPSSHSTRAAELLMRVNKELNVGNFELDWDGGAVMFRQSNVFPRNRFDEEVIAGLVHTAIAEMDRMTPFLGELCKTGKEMLPLVSVKDLLLREDLLPPVPEESD